MTEQVATPEVTTEATTEQQSSLLGGQGGDG